MPNVQRKTICRSAFLFFASAQACRKGEIILNQSRALLSNLKDVFARPCLMHHEEQ